MINFVFNYNLFNLLEGNSVAVIYKHLSFALYTENHINLSYYFQQNS